MTVAPTGVLVMAYGTPATPGDVEAYYTHIRRGRPPSPEQLANLRARYDALGGTSTLAARTADQVAGIAAALDQLTSDVSESGRSEAGGSESGGHVVTLGQKHASPFVEDGVAELVAAGVDRIVGLVLAPHFSSASVGQYHDRASAAAAEAGVAYAGIERWYDRDAYHRFLVGAVRDGLTAMTGSTGPSPVDPSHIDPSTVDPSRIEVVFTAHSLPERVLIDDPYADELEAGARRVATELGLREASTPSDGPSWSVGWQSAGATPEPWRGPDILEVIREVGASGRVDGLLVCPHGFVADHLEVAYDLDIEATAVAAETGVAFARTRALNDHPATLADLAHLITRTPRVAQAASTSDEPAP